LFVISFFKYVQAQFTNFQTGWSSYMTAPAPDLPVVEIVPTSTTVKLNRVQSSWPDLGSPWLTSLGDD
jgi:hypothetical protein